MTLVRSWRTAVPGHLGRLQIPKSYIVLSQFLLDLGERGYRCVTYKKNTIDQYHEEKQDTKGFKESV